MGYLGDTNEKTVIIIVNLIVTGKEESFKK